MYKTLKVERSLKKLKEKGQREQLSSYGLSKVSGLEESNFYDSEQDMTANKGSLYTLTMKHNSPSALDIKTTKELNNNTLAMRSKRIGMQRSNLLASQKANSMMLNNFQKPKTNERSLGAIKVGKNSTCDNLNPKNQSDKYIYDRLSTDLYQVVDEKCVTASNGSVRFEDFMQILYYLGFVVGQNNKSTFSEAHLTPKENKLGKYASSLLMHLALYSLRLAEAVALTNVLYDGKAAFLTYFYAYNYH